MFYIKDNRITTKYITDTKREIVLHEVLIGDKFWDSNDPYDKSRCLEIEQMLNKCGFKTRMAQNVESKIWSVAIIG